MRGITVSPENVDEIEQGSAKSSMCPSPLSCTALLMPAARSFSFVALDNDDGVTSSRIILLRTKTNGSVARSVEVKPLSQQMKH